MTNEAESTGKVFTLSKSIPIKQKGKPNLRITEIELETDLRLKHLEMFEKRSPKLRKLIREGKQGTPTTLTPSEFIPIISVLSGLPESAVREISLTDLEVVGDAIGEILESFFGKPPQTGKKSRGA